MTAHSLLDELEGVARLAEKATPGEWLYRQGTAVVILGQGAGGFDLSCCPQPEGNAQTIAAAVNFIRTHHAEIADMAKRLEAAERDAEKYAPCLWVQDADDGSWDTACGNKHLFIEGDSADNLYLHCPYCGGHLIEPNCDPATQEGEG